MGRNLCDVLPTAIFAIDFIFYLLPIANIAIDLLPIAIFAIDFMLHCLLPIANIAIDLLPIVIFVIDLRLFCRGQHRSPAQRAKASRRQALFWTEET